jgi:hypothetical protein
MLSTKKRSQKTCSKCRVLLSQRNWPVYDQKIGRHICKACRKIEDKKYHKLDPDYARKQKNRYRMRRSAVILAYGNACSYSSEDGYAICGEDDYTKLTIIGDVNYLYNNVVQKTGYQVVCYNCSKSNSYKDKYALQYKKQVIDAYGKCCSECKEDRIERLTLNTFKRYRWLIRNQFPKDIGIQVLCYNCKHSKIAAQKLAIDEADFRIWPALKY